MVMAVVVTACVRVAGAIVVRVKVGVVFVVLGGGGVVVVGGGGGDGGCGQEKSYNSHY